MEEEIFGPILPVIPFDHLDEAIERVKSKSHPLALYLFTNRKSEQKKVMKYLTFGGMTLNDNLLHVANPHLPFGGVGNSGMGSTYGRFGLVTFSTLKDFLKNAICH